MTEYEVIDVISSLRDEAGGHMMNFVSVLFGYVATAYFVGPKLSKIQVCAITFIYALWAPGPILATYDSAVATRSIYLTYRDSVNIELAGSSLIELAPTIAPAAAMFGWLVSVLFMLQIRRTANAPKAPPNKAIEADA